MNFKQMIKNELDNDTGLETRLSQKMGLANSSTLNKFANIPERELEDFECLLILVRELFPENEFEMMENYIKTLNPKRYTARMCLEYTQVNKMNKAHEHLLETMLNCKNALSKEWAEIYNIDFKVAEKKIKPLEGFDLLNELNVNSDEGKAYVEVCKYFIYYDLGLISSMELVKPSLTSFMAKIENNYIKNSYQRRLQGIESEVNLHQNNISEVRSSLNNIEKCESWYQQTLLYLTLGNSYIMESYDKALNNMKKSLLIAEKFNYKNRIIQAQRSINFLQNYWGYIPHYLNNESKEISDLHEMAFFYIRQKSEKGLEILEGIDENNLTDNQKGFYYFYKGLALNSKEFFMKSVKHFSKSGEKFYKNLPLIELKKCGIDDYILDALGF